jgi:hypothetical protein
MRPFHTLFVLATLALTLGACGRPYSTAPLDTARGLAGDAPQSEARAQSRAQVFAAAGDIAPSVNAFRDALGTLNANTPGSQAGGRREINWDAVPALFTNTDAFPGDFFNQPVVGRARGLVSATPGTGQRVSDVNFSDLNPAFGQEFVFFSPVRTFAPIGSNRMTITFFVPGSSTPATTSGFGVVFSDVDRRGSASIRLFDADGNGLGHFTAPAAAHGSSFVGVRFPDRPIARVEIRSGDAGLTPDAIDVGNRRGGDDEDEDDDLRAGASPLHRGPDHGRGHPRPRDLVIMDDFVYGEPIAPALESLAGSLPAAVGSTVTSRRLR